MFSHPPTDVIYPRKKCIRTPDFISLAWHTGQWLEEMLHPSLCNLCMLHHQVDDEWQVAGERRIKSFSFPPSRMSNGSSSNDSPRIIMKDACVRLLKEMTINFVGNGMRLETALISWLLLGPPVSDKIFSFSRVPLTRWRKVFSLVIAAGEVILVHLQLDQLKWSSEPFYLHHFCLDLHPHLMFHLHLNSQMTTQSHCS